MLHRCCEGVYAAMVFSKNVILLQGYFRALFTCIEQLLVSMNVEKIVLPAAEDAESIWTKKLGFKKISDEQVSPIS